ncbi:TNF receptor-associated factor 4 isoform X1 [Corapipo altera]|uniref:TNF receptor-associated factor 4 isoform X1 n=1 Tax=Corapipo altera TaxID=415028 RepID=UPI000FD637D5|nr:TNF receptor-associated factor 4 isoform X1 [Corapipo altera]
MMADGAVSCGAGAPGPHIRAAHLVPSCCPPPPPLGPSTWGCGSPIPCRPHPGQPPAPSLIPGAGTGEGLPGLQMVPCCSRRLAQAPGDRGCRALPGGGGLSWGGCLAIAFPSSDRWSGIRAAAPPGLRLDLVQGECSAVEGQHQCPGMGWQGPDGTSWLCHWCCSPSPSNSDPFVSCSEGVFKCPEDQLPLDYAKIYPDPELEAQVLSLAIRCIHSEEGCRWSGLIKHLQAHLSTCGFNVIPCPNRCSAKLSRRDLPEHVQHGCPKRRVKCEFCASDFTGEAFEGHQGTCPQESVYCENKCGARMMRRLLSQHTLAECPKRTQPCTYCSKEFVFDTIQNHQYQCPRYPVPCPNQCGTPSIPREDMPTHLKESCNTAMLLCPFKEAGCKHRCPKLAMGRHLEESTKAHLGMVCALVSRQRQEILELRRDMEELSVSSDGTLIWKIADYARKLQEAKARSNYEFFSPPFYTHKYGYKLQVSAFLNGNGSGESSHLSVYIRVLPGEYDNLLEWPFSYRVTFSLLDQSDPSLSKPQHITETFHPDPNWKNFQKPGASRSSLDESTLGFGYPKFISHEDIRKRNYVRDNAIFIKASVEIPQKILA